MNRAYVPQENTAEGGRMNPSRPAWAYACAIAVAVLCFVSAGGCSRGYIGPVDDTTEGQLELARRLVETGRYYDAILELEEFMSENPGSGLRDKALYYLGRAYLGKRDHALAGAEFERLLREFPGSDYAPDARYLLAVSSYEQSLPAELDPTMTLTAIDQLRLFIRLHPESPFVPDAKSRVDLLRAKMAKKQYLNGRLYLKLKEPEAARFYLERVLADYSDTPWAPKSMLAVAKSYEMEKEAGKATEEYRRLIRSYPDSEEAEEARDRIEELGSGDADAGMDLVGEEAKEGTEVEK